MTTPGEPARHAGEVPGLVVPDGQPESVPLSHRVGQARRTSVNGGEHTWTAQGPILGTPRPETETGIETGRLDV